MIKFDYSLFELDCSRLFLEQLFQATVILKKTFVGAFVLLINNLSIKIYYI